ncbi:MAG: response regulator transcription factor [Anaerolineae bacterium]|nr:response regulator transcription factor [Anaerolineae bacterium]
MIRLLLIDDHHLVRQGIRSLAERAGDIDVVGESEGGEKAIALVESLKPDVVLLDISMPEMNGLDVLERFVTTAPRVRVVILSMHSDEAVVQRALKLGARGYLLKSALSEELLLAIRAAYRDEVYLSPSISRTLLDGFVNSLPASPVDLLTARERQVLQLIAEGNTNPQIARMLSLSVKTVEKHRTSLMDKLNIHDLAGLVRFAVKQGIIPLDS